MYCLIPWRSCGHSSKILNEICIIERTKRILTNRDYVNLCLFGFCELNLEILYVFFFFFLVLWIDFSWVALTIILLLFWVCFDVEIWCWGRESVMVLPFDLQDFLLRARVLNLYRQALRTAQRAPVHARAELRQTIRQEMEKNRNCNDKQRIRFLISEGLERLKGLDEMLDMQGHW